MGHGRDDRERSHLWMAVWITIALSGYRLTTQCVTPLRLTISRYTDLPLAEILTNALFFWLLVMLWFAYRSWRGAVYRQRELERVVSSISPDVLLVIGQDRTILMCNGAIKAMFGYAVNEVVGQRTDLLYFDRRVTGEKREIFRYLEKVGFHVGSATGRRRDGTTFPLEIITGTIAGSSGVVALIRDITDRRNTEAALRDSEERFALFMRHLPAGVCIKDDKGRNLYLNEYFHTAFGWNLDSCVGMQDADLYPPDVARRLGEEDTRALTSGVVAQGTHEIPQRGTLHVYETHRFVIPRAERPPMLGGIFVDVTERRRAEEERRRLEIQMLQSQKLESLGLLGGGIAHDFNNLLAGILGYADLAMNELPESPRARHCIQQVIDTSKRAADLCNQLLAYSGEGKFVVETVDISALVEEISHFLEVTVSKKAEIEYGLGRGLPGAECDVTQIRQVVMNLIVNASDALGDTPGKIRVSTDVRECGREYLRNTYLGENLTEGRYVSIVVSDTGCGMDEATKARIFDPFFTTKFTGRGLGLAAVMGIVRGHRGAIRVDSAPGKGTTFRVLLPASSKAVRKRGAVAAGGEAWVASGTVLVADDEEVIRAVASTMLEKIGFHVLSARDGREAVELFRENRDKIRAMLLDLTMPVLGGMEAYNEMKREGLEVPVIFSSGYNKESEIRVLSGDNRLGFLQKPYQLDAVRRRFREVLGE